MTTDDNSKVALVFGASGELGRAVVEGLQEYNNANYSKVYAFTRGGEPTNSNNKGSNENLKYLTDALNATIVIGDISNGNHVKNALLTTKATDIFLVTTTQLPTEVEQTSGYFDAAESEFQVIVQFFHILKECYDIDQLSRHVVFSVRDNVQDVTQKVLETTGTLWIAPLEDGSIVPHYSAKGKGGEYAVTYLQDTPDLKLTLITIPFLYSNFLGFFAPLPINNQFDRCNQWTLSACFGDGSQNKIDMMSASDLAYIVPNIFANPAKYCGKNLRLVGEQISMDSIASMLSDLFGKDVIYNPLTVEEVSMLPIPTAPAMAQMCQFVGNPPDSLRHDIDATIDVCFPRKPQLFKDWLLIHSGSEVFQRVGLDLDAPEIQKVTVFGATSLEGTSVVKGLLADTRKKYQVRVTSRHADGPKTKALKELDPDRIEIVYANLDDLLSCQEAVKGSDGVFLVTDFYEEAIGRDMDVEEQHARNVIDACELSTTIKHLVFSTKESADEMNRIMNLGLEPVQDSKGKEGTVIQFDAKARAAAYARTKKLSVTYVLMPCYSEMFFDMIERRDDQLVITVPLLNNNSNKKVMCISVDDLGPAVANIFDSYQVYAGHEVGLVTDFVTVSEVRDIIEEVFFPNGSSSTIGKNETINTTMEKEDEITADDEEEDGRGADRVASTTKDERMENPNGNNSNPPTTTQQPYAVQANHTYIKDLGQMFVYMSHTSAVQKRHSIAKTMKLVPSAKPLRQWIQQNVDNVEFREKLGLR